MLAGLTLIIVAAVSMILANSPLLVLYESLLHLHLPGGMSLEHFINDGLMVVFFYFVGLEIKKELLFGELSSRAKAALPVAAALGGMIVPALIYTLFNYSTDSVHGWGIPMATDIAFAVGVLALLGNKVPSTLKVFLLALAIVDDLGAILVIALFYTENISLTALAAAVLGLGAIWFLQKKVTISAVYVAVGILVWLAVLKSGIHATIAGVLLGFVTRRDQKSLEDLIHKLEPWVHYAIMPIFAFANAGVSLQGVDASELFTNSVILGVFLGLVLGKPFGVLSFSYIAAKLRWAQLPRSSNWPQIGAIGCLAGIGFTMALFIGNLALGGTLHEVDAKLGILIASLFASVLGLIWLKLLRDV